MKFRGSKNATISPPSSTAAHSVLVVGGTGFVGYHLVSYFISRTSFTNIAVLSRSATGSKNRVEGATYHAGDLTKHSEIKELLDKLKPTVIIHAASPSPVTGTKKEYEHINIKGTENLLRVAKESEYVRVFIYTSSSTLAKGLEHLNLDESYPLAHTDPKASPYAKSKADAEVMVLQNNHPTSAEDTNWVGSLATAALRFPIIYGIRDTTTIPGYLNALAKGQTTTTLGDGKNLWDFCSAENAAVSHVLFASALLNGSQSPKAKVDGEVFNINGGAPYLFLGLRTTVLELRRLLSQAAGQNHKSAFVVCIGACKLPRVGVLDFYL